MPKLYRTDTDHVLSNERREVKKKNPSIEWMGHVTDRWHFQFSCYARTNNKSISLRQFVAPEMSAIARTDNFFVCCTFEKPKKKEKITKAIDFNIDRIDQHRFPFNESKWNSTATTANHHHKQRANEWRKQNYYSQNHNKGINHSEILHSICQSSHLFP